MSLKATNFVRRLRGLDATEKVVGFVYADHANHETGDTYPSMDTVAEEAGLADRSTASKATGRLSELKIIVTDKPSKGGPPTVWRFNYSLYGCPSTITLAPINRGPRPQSTVTKSHSSKQSNRVPQSQSNCDSKSLNCDPKQPNCVPESHKGVESKSKGTSKASSTPAPTPGALSLTSKQVADFWGTAFQLGWTKEQITAHLVSSFRVRTVAALDPSQFSQLLYHVKSVAHN